MRDVFVVAAKRTPFGAYGGSLATKTAIDLQEIAFSAALDAGQVKPEQVDSVVVGNVFYVGPLYIPGCNVCLLANSFPPSLFCQQILFLLQFSCELTYTTLLQTPHQLP